MNIDELSEFFWENGYLKIDKFFDSELMEFLNEVILEHYGMQPEWFHNDEFLKKSATEVVPWFPYREGNSDFVAIDNNPLLKILTEAILGESWRELYCMAMFSKEGTKGQAWHQDCPPENSNQFNLNRLFYPHEITPDLGGEIVVLPGSHKMGALSQGGGHDDIEGQIMIRPNKGTLILLHGHCWHRVMPIKGKFRISVNTRAIPKGTPEDITDIAVYRNMRYRFSTNEVLDEK